MTVRKSIAAGSTYPIPYPISTTSPKKNAKGKLTSATAKKRNALRKATKARNKKK